MYILMGRSISPSPSAFEATLKGKNLLPWGANSLLRVTPKFEVIQLTPLKLELEIFFFLICQRIWKTVKRQGKIWEKSGNFEVDDKWQS